VRHPIVGFSRSPGVVAAVTNAGGPGVLAASAHTPPLPPPPKLVSEAWQRIDAAAGAGHEGALKLESFFVGQVVGSFSRLRPAAEITRQIIGDCEVRLAELAALLPAGPPAAS
jgi:hypothetical protein